MKQLSAAASIALCLCVVGCANQSVSQPSYYRARGADNQLTVTGDLEARGVFSRSYAVNIFVEGEPAGSGSFKVSGGQIVGQYRGKRVESDCTVSALSDGGIGSAAVAVVTGDHKTVRCLVHIDGDRAASLVMQTNR